MDFKDLTEEKWLEVEKDLHFQKSELGDYKKKHTDLTAEFETLKNSKGEEYTTLDTKYKELENKNLELGKTGRNTILKYEGQKLGLTEQDISEIVLTGEDDVKTIIEKASAKKASLDKRVEDFLKDQGISSTILGKKDDKQGTGFVAQHRKKGKADAKKYYDI